MTRYSVQPRDRMLVKGYEVLLKKSLQLLVKM